MASLCQLPVELKCHILSYLLVRDVENAQTWNREWYDLIRNNDGEIYRSIISARIDGLRHDVSQVTFATSPELNRLVDDLSSFCSYYGLSSEQFHRNRQCREFVDRWDALYRIDDDDEIVSLACSLVELQAHFMGLETKATYVDRESWKQNIDNIFFFSAMRDQDFSATELYDRIKGQGLLDKHRSQSWVSKYVSPRDRHRYQLTGRFARHECHECTVADLRRVLDPRLPDFVCRAEAWVGYRASCKTSFARLLEALKNGTELDWWTKAKVMEGLSLT